MHTNTYTFFHVIYVSLVLTLYQTNCIMLLFAWSLLKISYSFYLGVECISHTRDCKYVGFTLLVSFPKYKIDMLLADLSALS